MNSRFSRAIPVAIAVALTATFVLVARPFLATVQNDFDEAWLILDARAILHGLRPMIDFAHHEIPLHLYLLALSGKVFGQTLYGYRMLSVVSIAGSGLLLFLLVRPFAGPLAALAAAAAFLFAPAQSRALAAVPETPCVFFMLLGATLLFVVPGRLATRASAVAFVLAVMTKPTNLPIALVPAASLAYGREWRRLVDFAVAGMVAGIAGLLWTLWVSDGVFAEMVLQLGRIGSGKVGMWSVDSGFADMRRRLGIETRSQWAVSIFESFYQVPGSWAPFALFVMSLLSLPIWVLGCARERPALRAWAVLWPASYLLLNFVALPFVSPRYFIPYVSFSAFLLAGAVWLAQRWLPPVAVGAGCLIGTVVLALRLIGTVAESGDPWYWGRTDWIANNISSVASFNPMLFAASGKEPGCGFTNPVLTYGGFGEAVLATEHTARFRWSDARLVDCLRKSPETHMVVDWAFFFFTRTGSPLRTYLAGEGSAQRLFFSPEAMEQWDRPLLETSPFR